MQTKPATQPEIGEPLPHPLNLRYWLTPKAEEYLALRDRLDQLGQ